jgi:hypothetical protein
MPKTRRRRGGSMYSEGQVLQKDCNSTLSGCNVTGSCESEKVVLDNRNDNDDGWVGHKSGVSGVQALDIRNEIRIKDVDNACWKPVTMGGKRKHRRKTSKKGGSKRKLTRRRR